jgi:hypothetical protein
MYNDVVVVKEIIRKDFEVMEPNTFIHPDEKRILKAHADELREYFDPTDVDTKEFRLMRNAILILDRISL